MYVIIWEYQVRDTRLNAFEKIYTSNGKWSELFQKATGYIGTDLLRDETGPKRFITIDRWDTSESFKAFLEQFKKEYEILDAQCKGLTEHEIPLGKWESVDDETR